MNPVVDQNHEAAEKVSRHGWLVLVLILVVLIGGGAFVILRAKSPQLFGGSTEYGILRERFRSDRSYSPAVGYFIPPMRLRGTGGAFIDTDSLKGKPTMIVFEATWCTYCKEEVADLNRIAKEGKVNYISLDIHEPASLVDSFVAENGITHPWYYDEDGSVSTWFLLAGTPTHLFVDKEGKIVSRLTGYQTGAQLDEAVAKLTQ